MKKIFAIKSFTPHIRVVLPIIICLFEWRTEISPIKKRKIEIYNMYIHACFRSAQPGAITFKQLCKDRMLCNILLSPPTLLANHFESAKVVSGTVPTPILFFFFKIYILFFLGNSHSTKFSFFLVCEQKNKMLNYVSS